MLTLSYPTPSKVDQAMKRLGGKLLLGTATKAERREFEQLQRWRSDHLVNLPPVRKTFRRKQRWISRAQQRERRKPWWRWLW